MNLKKIGLLDLGLRYKGNYTNEEVYQQFIREAILADNLGFSRKWLTEHYQNKKDLIWLSPEMLIPLLAAYTKQIKIGIAGALIYYNNVMQIVANYKLVNNIFHNRIDLGFAKGTIKDGYENYFNEKELFEDRRESILKKIATTIALLNEGDIKQSVNIPPIDGNIPSLWNLISSGHGYLDSLKLNTNCSRTLFFSHAELDPQIDKLLEYKESFSKQNGFYPEVNIVVTGTCQKTDKLCKQILDVARNKRDEMNEKTIVFGTPNQVFDRLCELAEQYSVSEIIFLENSRVFKHRLDSIKNISKVFSLREQ